MVLRLPARLARTGGVALLSLRFWSRGAAIASVTLVAVCGFLIVDDELNARRARAELHDFWQPARELNKELLQAEKTAEASIATFLATPSTRSHANAERSVAQLQATLINARLPQGDPELMTLALASGNEARSWLDHGAAAIAAASPNAGQVSILNSERALTHTTGIRLADLNFGAADVRQSLSHTNSVLRITAVVETLLLIALLSLLIFGLRLRVLAPLTRLRDDLDRSSRHLAHAIRPTGPAEIAAVAHDAESLRRSLIHELDVSDHATQALTQSSPLTVAVRAELDRHDQTVKGVFGFHRPAEGVIAGDWWWAGEDHRGAQLFAIADVSGHGVHAGMLALESRTLVTSALTKGDSPEVICQDLAARSFESGMFLTLFVGTLRGDTLTYCSAGHQDAVLVSPFQAQVLPTTGPIISALGGDWELGFADLAHNSALIAATDGLLDHAPQSDFTLLGQRAWRTSGRQASECLELVLSQAREQSTQWSDDVTVVIITPT